jgi:hypothetical protein
MDQFQARPSSSIGEKQPRLSEKALRTRSKRPILQLAIPGNSGPHFAQSQPEL